MQSPPPVRVHRRGKTDWVVFLLQVLLIPLGYSLFAALFTDQTPQFAYLAALVVTVAGATLAQIAKKYPAFPISDIGFIYVGTILLYFFVPILKFIFSDYQWGLLSDIRLYEINPSQNELIPLMTCFLFHTLAFGICYLHVLRKSRPPTFAASTAHADPKRLFGFLAVLFIVRFVFSMAIGASSDYNEKVVSVADQPLIFRQLFFFLQSVVFGFGFITLTLAGLQYRRRRWVFWLVLLAFAVPPIVTLGSRHEAFTFILLATILHHSFVKPIPTRKLLTGGAILLVTMIVLGFVRSYTEGGSLLLASTEFEAMFATFYHMTASVGASPPWTVYLSDVLSLVPQQLLPVDKLDPGTWYMKAYFPDVADENPEVGYGFGVISEAAIGWGVPELIVRGVVLGYIFAKMANAFHGRSKSPIFAFIYLFCLVTVFRTFRTSSFELLKSLSFYILPGIVFYELLLQRRQRMRPPAPHESPASP